jgi:hypothetical protein
MLLIVQKDSEIQQLFKIKGFEDVGQWKGPIFNLRRGQNWIGFGHMGRRGGMVTTRPIEKNVPKLEYQSSSCNGAAPPG